MLNRSLAVRNANSLPHPLKPQRRHSSNLHFYRNKQLELWAAKSPTALTLRQLVRTSFYTVYYRISRLLQVFYGRSMTPERLINVSILFA